MISSWVVPDLGSRSEHSNLYRFAICEVFTPVALAGTSLAIFLDGRHLVGEQMRALAGEMNFAETVFLLPPDATGDARVRIFTPGRELPFAGHSILGAAVAFGQATGLDTVNLETSAGLVPVSLHRAEGRITFGWMKRPIPDVSSYEPARSRPEQVRRARHRGELLRRLWPAVEDPVFLPGWRPPRGSRPGLGSRPHRAAPSPARPDLLRGAS